MSWRNHSDPDGHASAIGTITPPANGTVVANADRTLSYTPKAGFTGTDTFLYAVNDGRGGSAQGSVAVIVRNRSPVAGANSVVTDANTPVRNRRPRQRQRPRRRPRARRRRHRPGPPTAPPSVNADLDD